MILEGISQRYRNGELVVREQADESLFKRVMSKAEEWKRDTVLYTDKTVKGKIVRELTKYHEFSEAMLANPKLAEECFKIVFTSRFPIKHLVTFFKICATDLKEALLIPSVGFHWKQQKMLHIVNGDIQFLINGTYQSISDDKNMIHLNDGEAIAWGALKKKLGTYNIEIPEHVVVQEKGLIKFRSQGMMYPENGVWKKIETKDCRWWEDPRLPVFQTLSKEKLQKARAIAIPDGTSYVRTVDAAYMDATKFDGAHGSEGIWARQEEDGMYRYYPIGKYARKYPNSTLRRVHFVGNFIIKFLVNHVINPVINILRAIDTGFKYISFFGDSVPADLTVPDPTPLYFSIRKHAFSPHLLTRDQAEARLTELGNMANDLTFQWGNENCAYLAEQGSRSIFGDAAPSYFKTPMLEASPGAPVSWFIALFKLFEGERRAKVMKLWVHALGGGRTYESPNGTKYSITRSSFMKDWSIFVPGKIAERIEKKLIPGKVTFGKA